MKNSHNKRAELSGKTLEEIKEILSEYSKVYQQSDIVVDVDENTDRDIDAVVDKVVSEIKNYTKEK